MIHNSRKGSSNKIKIHYGISDYYNHYMNSFELSKDDSSNNPFYVSKKDYNSIIEDFHAMIIDEIIDFNYEFKLPFDLGMLALRKFKPTLKVDENGKLINKLPVDIRSTMNLWDKNEEAKKNKVLVRYTNKHSRGYVFTIHYYKKYKARFKNKTLYSFETVRSFKEKVNKRASTGELDAYLLY